MKTFLFTSLAFVLAFGSTKIIETPHLNLTCQVCGNEKFVAADKVEYVRFTEDEEAINFGIKHRYMCQHCGTFSEVEATKK